MTERKPPGVNFETWIDRQIRMAEERGEFDNLPGAGKPLPGLDRPYDELWWVKNYLRREGLSTDVLLPASLQLRKEIERLPETVRDLPSERAVRELVHALNRRIAEWLRAPSGPHVRVRPVDVESIVERWRADRAEGPGGGSPTPAPEPVSAGREHRPAWWRRILRGRRAS